MKRLLPLVAKNFDFLLYLISNVFFKFVSGISMILLARYLIPQDLGLIRTLIAFLTMVGILVNLGISDFFLYKSSTNHPHRTFNHIARIYLFVYFLFYPAAVFLYSLLYKAPLWIIVVAYIKILFDWLTDIVLKSVQAQNKFRIASLIIFMNSLTIALPIFCLYICSLQVYQYLYWFVFSAGLGSLSALIIYKIYFGKWLLTNKLGFNKKLLKHTLPFFVSSLTVFVYLQSDVLMLGLFKGNWEVAKYTSATAIIFAMYVFPTVIYNYFLPKLIASVQNVKKFVQYQMLFTVLTIFIVGILSLVLYVGSPWILHLIYKGKYDTSIYILRILTGSLFLHGFSFVAGASLTAFGKQKIRASVQLIAALVNIVLNLFILNMLGAEGAAISTLITEIFLLIGYVYFTIKEERKLLQT